MKVFNRVNFAAVAGVGLCGTALAFGPEAAAAPLPTGGPVCVGGHPVATTSGEAGAPVGAAAPVGVGVAGPAAAGPGPAAAGPAPATATVVDATTVTPCSSGGVVDDQAGLAGAAAPLALPGPLPIAPVPPVPVLPPVPVVPGVPPAVPLVAPGPAGAALASPLAGVLTDVIGFPVFPAGGSK